MLVLDASAALELLLNTARGGRAFDWIVASGEELHAPHLIDVEVAQIVRRLVSRKELRPEEGKRVLDGLSALRMERYPHTVLLHRIWDLRNSLSAYDGAYIALAEMLGATALLTCDGKMSRSHGHNVSIHVLS